MANKTLETKKMTWDQMNDVVEKNGWKFDEVKDSENLFLIKEGRKNIGYIEVIEDEKKKQVHTHQDRDIKIDSTKIGDFGVKLIYHRMKDDSKQYRIFISYKDDNGKLIRRRLVNDAIKAIQDSEKKMKEYYMNLDVKTIKKVI